VFEGLAASLRRLQLDYVDVVYAHRMDEETNLREAVMALSGVVDKGMALYWGTSEWSVDALHSARAIVMQCHLHMPVVEQPQYNLFVRHKVEQRLCQADARRTRSDDVVAAQVRRALGQVRCIPAAGQPTTSSAASGGSARPTPPPPTAVPNAVKSARTIDVKSSDVKVQIKTVTKLQQLIQVENLGCTVAQLAIAWCSGQ
jgi:aryl-alcohol dehydrogenase-like predicted oxidoreductase